jgi:hypothetical protein
MALGTRQQYTLVDPTTQPISAAFSGASRLADLRGKKLGLIDDSKPNAKELLEELADLMKTRYEIAGVMYHPKPSASKPADPSVVAEMARECDYAIVAIGD